MNIIPLVTSLIASYKQKSPFIDKKLFLLTISMIQSLFLKDKDSAEEANEEEGTVEVE